MFGPRAFSEARGPCNTPGKSRQTRNWSCGCKPGILGPPVSPLPAILRTTVELLATGPPTAWKLSYANSNTQLELKWTPSSNNPSNRALIFPPPLLTAIASLPSEPATWSLEQDAHTLSCQIVWSTAPSAVAAPAPSTPVMASPDLDDSGFSSPASPTSPIPFDLPSSSDIGSQTSPNDSQTTLDAATSTTTPRLTSTSCQTAAPIPFHLDAGIQTSPGPLQDTTTTSPTTADFATQTSPAADPLPTKPDVSPAATVNSNSAATGKKKKRKKSKTTNKPTFISTSAPQKPACSDAATAYDPSDIRPEVCRLCWENVLPGTSPASHLLACEGLPDPIAQTREGFLNDWAESAGLSLDTLGTLTELHLEHYLPSDIEPDHGTTKTDFLVGQLLVRSFPDYDLLLKYQGKLTTEIESLKSAARAQLNLHTDAKLELFNTYPTIPSNDTEEDDCETVLAQLKYHPMDDLDDDGSYTSELNSDHEMFNDYY